MKCLQLLFSCLLLLSCHAEERVKRYTISDLTFPEDNIREARKRNSIAKSYFYIDSAVYNDRHSGKLISRCDSEVTLTYDTNGNLIRDINGSYQYNGENIMTHSIAGRCLSSSRDYTYLFHSNERFLFCVGGDTTSYEFDTSGKIIAARSHGAFNTEWVYRYNDLENVNSSLFKLNSKYPMSDIEKNITKTYYYSGKKLDSIIIVYTLYNDSTYTERDYFDEKELLSRSVQYLRHCPWCSRFEEPLVYYSVKNISRDSL